MKKRNGFVSNSSSSSFIIHVGKDHDSRHNLYLLESMMENEPHYEGSAVDKIDCRERKFIVRFLSEEWGYGERSVEQNFDIDEMLERSEKGESIYHVEIDHCQHDSMEFFNKHFLENVIESL